MASFITAGNATNGLQVSSDNTGILELRTGTGSGTTAMTLSTAQAATFAAGVTATTGSFSGNLSFNSGYGSSAVAYGCRAWVNFNGTGTVAIRASGNVTSITDSGVGIYVVNFTNAMPDANFAALAYSDLQQGNLGSYTSSSIQLATRNAAGSLADAVSINVAIFR